MLPCPSWQRPRARRCAVKAFWTEAIAGIRWWTLAAAVTYISAASLFVVSALAAVAGLFGPGVTRGGVTTVRTSDHWSSVIGPATELVVFGALAAGVCVLMVRPAVGFSRAALGLRVQDRRRRIVGGFPASTIAYVGVLFGSGKVADLFLTVTSLHGRGYPYTAGTTLPGDVSDFLASLGAGLEEELVLFAIPIAYLARRRCSTATILVAVTAIRLSIHLYYGWESCFVLVWIPLGFALYRASGTIWPLVIGHAVYDSFVMAQTFLPSWWAARDENVLTWFMWTAGAIGILSVVRYRRRMPSAALEISERSGRRPSPDDRCREAGNGSVVP